MARLRIRIELNRGGVGVPLHKLARVVDEAQTFFQMLAEDVHVDKSKGEWLGFDFDHESLNFTAEFVGPVTPGQVSAFNAAFDGATPLRRTTISQFARITEAIEEDELIGFGLYLNEEGNEPSEWRCLSRRDALRITDEIQVLSEASGEFDGARGLDKESCLPAVGNADMGGRLFSERRARSSEAGKLSAFVREVEANLSKRITRVENKLEDHSGEIQDLRTKSTAAEDSMRRLLAAVETFCEQAARQVETMPQKALPAASPQATPPPWRGRNWRWAAGVAAAAIVIASSGLLLWKSHSGERTAQAAVPKQAAASPAPAVQPAESPKEPQSSQTPPATARVDLEASQPVWVSLANGNGTTLISRLFNPGDTRSFDLPDRATLRVGNAAGISIRLNGTPLGPIGPPGKIREVRFKGASYKIVDPTSKIVDSTPASPPTAP